MLKFAVAKLVRAAALSATLALLFAVHSAEAQEKTKTERLLKSELDPFTADENGWTHMHWAAAANDGEAIRRLIELGASPTPIALEDDSEFSADGRRRAALLGLKMGDWINEGDTPLGVAAWFGGGIAASVLIVNGANVNVKTNRGSTPLHSATHSNAVDVARMLLESGADVNAKGGKYDEMPLHDAAWYNASETAAFLLENGAEINAKTNDGRTPLYWAAHNNAPETAALLLENGASINAQSDIGWTPLDEAIDEGHDEMQSFLRRNGGRCNKQC